MSRVASDLPPLYKYRDPLFNIKIFNLINILYIRNAAILQNRIISGSHIVAENTASCRQIIYLYQYASTY